MPTWSSGLVVAWAIALAHSSAASAGLAGHQFHLDGVYSGYGPGGSGYSINMGDVVVGSGPEWSNSISYHDDGELVATLYQQWDISDSSITFSMDVTAGSLTQVTIGPGDFNGLIMTDLMGDVPAIASISVASWTGSPVTFLEYYGYPPDDPALSDWLDVYDAPVGDASRGAVDGAGALYLDMQGIVWTDPDHASLTFEVVFVPAPSGLALLGILGLVNRRRR